MGLPLPSPTISILFIYFSVVCASSPTPGPFSSHQEHNKQSFPVARSNLLCLLSEVLSKGYFLSESTPFNPNPTDHCGGKDFTAGCSPASTCLLFSVVWLHELFQSLLQPLSFTSGIRGQSPTIQSNHTSLPIKLY